MQAFWKISTGTTAESVNGLGEEGHWCHDHSWVWVRGLQCKGLSRTPSHKSLPFTRNNQKKEQTSPFPPCPQCISYCIYHIYLKKQSSSAIPDLSPSSLTGPTAGTLHTGLWFSPDRPAHGLHGWCSLEVNSCSFLAASALITIPSFGNVYFCT